MNSGPMMKVENIRIAISGLINKVYAGQLSKDKTYWLSKKDVTSDFLRAVVEYFFDGSHEVHVVNGKQYKVEVTNIKKE